MGNLLGRMLQMEPDKREDDLQAEMAKKYTRELEYENSQLKTQVAELQADKDAAHSALDEQALAIKTPIPGDDASFSQQALQEDQTEYYSRRCKKLENDMNVLKLKSEDDLNTERQASQKQLEEQRLQYEQQIEYLQAQQKPAQPDNPSFNTSIQGSSSPPAVQIDNATVIDDLQEQLAEQRLQYEVRMQSLQDELHSLQQASQTKEAPDDNPSISTRFPAFMPPPIMHINDSVSIEKLKVLHATDLDEQRRLIDFFKNNSERGSKEARGLRVENKALMESLEEMDKELEGRMSHIYALEAQLEEIAGPEGKPEA